MKKFLKSLGTIMLRPFSTEIVYTLVLWVVACGYFTFFSFRKGLYHYGVYLILLAYVVAVAASFVANANKHVAKVLRPLMLIVFFMISAVDMFCVSMFETHMSADFLGIIANTNKQESMEFFSVFVQWWQVVLFILVVVALFFIIYKIRFTLRKKWIVLPIGLFVLALVALCHNSRIIRTEFVDYTWKFSFEEIVDLRQHPTHPDVVEIDSIHPKNIVIIIGESFVKQHSSIYGYEKCTNPLLSQLVVEGNMVAFKKPYSPTTNTTSTFKYILNTHILSDDSAKKWYEYTNVIEALSSVGYKTFWVSNQNEKGVFDNLPSGHAKICDVSLFNENWPKGYDGVLLDMLNMSELAERNCVFYHLYGQHETYEKRFPSEFVKFKASDYKDKPEHQRQTLADYDNATIYNDYVVNEIIKKYKNKDALVFYFSDHGGDLFVTDPNYAAHAKITPESQKVGKEIPFMVYISDGLLQRNPALKSEVERLAKEPFCTDHFIFLALQLSGYAIK